MEDMESVMNIHTNKITQKLIEQKEALLKRALFKIAGEEIDLLQEANKRFPRIAITRTPEGEETYWWNSGDLGPTRVITFTGPGIRFDGPNKIIAEINHY